MSVFIPDLPRGVLSKDLEAIFGKYGRIKRCEITRNRRSGYVHFFNENDAQEVVGMTGFFRIRDEILTLEMDRSSGTRACYRCNQEGHQARDCPNSRSRSRSPASRDEGDEDRRGRRAERDNSSRRTRRDRADRAQSPLFPQDRDPSYQPPVYDSLYRYDNDSEKKSQAPELEQKVIHITPSTHSNNWSPGQFGWPKLEPHDIEVPNLNNGWASSGSFSGNVQQTGWTNYTPQQQGQEFWSSQGQREARPGVHSRTNSNHQQMDWSNSRDERPRSRASATREAMPRSSSALSDSNSIPLGKRVPREERAHDNQWSRDALPDGNWSRAPVQNDYRRPSSRTNSRPSSARDTRPADNGWTASRDDRVAENGWGGVPREPQLACNGWGNLSTIESSSQSGWNSAQYSEPRMNSRSFGSGDRQQDRQEWSRSRDDRPVSSDWAGSNIKQNDVAPLDYGWSEVAKVEPAFNCSLNAGWPKLDKDVKDSSHEAAGRPRSAHGPRQPHAQQTLTSSGDSNISLNQSNWTMGSDVVDWV